MRFYIAIIVLFTALDQGIKIWVRSNLTNHSYVEWIPNFIHLTYQENKGVSFSFLADMPDLWRAPLLAGISFVVIMILMVYLYRNFALIGGLERWGFSLILAGAFGNLIDRAFRQSVTDYMYFHYYDKGFFVNNFADDLISIGFVLVVLQGLKGSKKEDDKEKETKNE